MSKTVQSILVIGTGPVGSAQPTSFPAAVATACQVLTAAGKDVTLVTSDPNAPRDNHIAGRIFVAPLTVDFISQVIRRERPDAILGTIGGQSAVHILRQVQQSGLLRQLHIPVLDTNDSILNTLEDGEAFRHFLGEQHLPNPESTYIKSDNQATDVADKIGYPVLMRRGANRGIANNADELRQLISNTDHWGRLRIERAINGLKAVECVLVRDNNNTKLLIGTTENFDPVGVNPANTIVLSPAQTITDHERNVLRAAAFRVLDALDIRGTATFSFALDDTSADWYLLKVRVGTTWATELTQTATAYPITEVSTQIALGRNVDEIEIGAGVPAVIEPTQDAIMTRFPQFGEDHLNGATLGPQLVASGAILGAGANAESAILEGLRIQLGAKLTADVVPATITNWDDGELTQHIIRANALRLPTIWSAFDRGYTLDELVELSRINVGLLAIVQHLSQLHQQLTSHPGDLDLLREAKRYGITDAAIANRWDMTTDQVAALRAELAIQPTFKAIDGGGQIINASRSYYSSFGDESEPRVGTKPRVVIVTPTSTHLWLNEAQGAVTAALADAITQAGYAPVMITNSTVKQNVAGVRRYLATGSTEEILTIIHHEDPIGVICQASGNDGAALAGRLRAAGVNVLGSNADSVTTFDQSKAGAAVAGESDSDWEVSLDFTASIAPGSTHLAVDALSDGETVAVLGVINSLEHNADVAGTVLAVTPPRKGVAALTRRVTAITVNLAKMYGLIGFVHTEFVVNGHQIIVRRVAPTVNATVPFLAKTTTVDFGSLAAHVYLGNKLADLGITSGQLAQADGVHVLLPVYRQGLPAPDTDRPEMVQTGVVMGSDTALGKALIKAFAAAHQPLPDHGPILLDLADDKASALAGRLRAQGFQIQPDGTRITRANVRLVITDSPSADVRAQATARTIPIINSVCADAMLRVYEARAFSLEPLPPVSW